MGTPLSERWNFIPGVRTPVHGSGKLGSPVSRLPASGARRSPFHILSPLVVSASRWSRSHHLLLTRRCFLCTPPASMRIRLLLFHFVKKELHLVAMASRKNPMSYACFWGFIVQSRLYESSVMMPNLRCLGIVFDLDETLMVANTIWSFKDQDQCSSMKNK